MPLPADAIKPWKAIVAMADKNRAIGLNGGLPWRLPEDLAFFKQMTTGHTVVMGRKTMDEIKKPLPRRLNVVLTNQQDLVAPGFTIAHTLADLDEVAVKGDLFIIGGAQLFAVTLPQCCELFLTHVKGDYDGDTFLPPFEHLFSAVETLRENDDLRIVRYRNKALPA
ncbi:dihydrofolate reductase [Ruficoccus sp. ZRK36]|uniref:dihydrofolate reductase n=1 Tax=Ruficoccus sp. ZRK36 TaxID=2866311 RepID=UPI001C734E57|nr:dihydrofolate reductase [Ruficoccus sp. ZRK36]QYY35830.1 dihydrofolate reductase [Ruficoccus sp. ZRK36]